MFTHILHLLRLHKIAGAFLIYLPCLWSLKHQLSFYDICRFFIGAMVMRSSGCIINDFFDRSFDRHVERTKNRPLASQALSPFIAFFILFLLLCCGFGVWLTLKTIPQIISFVAALGAILYPFLKRWTYYPQLGLGIIFNSGIWVSWFEYHNSISSFPLLLYVAGIFWTLSYDSAYALQDVTDDIKIGVKSTAVRFQEKTPFFILGCQIMMSLCLYPLIGFKACLCFLPFFHNTLNVNVILGILILFFL